MKKSGVILVAASIIVVLLVAVYLRCERGERYNLLLITLDTTRADHLGCYGHAGAATPTLDNLADTGVKFNRAFCNVPLTLPSHATIMTGLYPPEHGCRVNGAHGLGEGLTTLAEVFAARGYRAAAFVAAFVLDSKFGLNRGFQTYDEYEVPYVDLEEIYDDSIMYRYRRADKVADAALSWLEKHSRKPFFCWAHFFDPHRPYYVDRPSSLLDQVSAYDREITFMDSQISRLIDYLKERNLLEKTAIIAVGDHGEGLGEHGEDEHGLLLYDSVMRVPLIISFPGHLPEGKEAEDLVSTVDLFPTIVEMFGWTSRRRISGKSFAPALSGKAVPQEAFYSETEFPLTEYGWSPLRSVTTPEWKYIQAPREELYYLRGDLQEKRNVAREQPEKMRELKALLAAIEGKMVIKESSEVKLDELSQRVLESLGYLGGGASRKKETASLRDPKAAIGMRREFIQAMEYRREGKTGKTEAILRKLIKKSPESYTFRYALAKMFYEKGRYKEARREFEEMVGMVPGEYRTHYNLGKALVKLGLYNRAIGEFRTALELDPEQTSGYNNLGIALLRAGQIQEAMDVFRTSISVDFNQCDPHNNLGNALLSLARVDEALEEFRCAVEVDPDFFEGHYNLGLVLLDRGKYEEAARAFRQAVRLRPDFAEARNKLRIALALGKEGTE